MPRRAWWPDGGADDAASARLLQAFQEQGPFEGLLGFSEGARAAQLACRLALEGALAPPSFVVLCGAPRLPGLAAVALKSLHFAGQKDTVVPLEESRSCAEAFREAEWVEPWAQGLAAGLTALRNGLGS